MTLEEALVSVWKQPLIDGATTVELEGRKHTVKKTSRHHLRQVDFSFEGQQLRGLERNPHTQSRWARLAQEGKRIMQFLRAGRYVAVVEIKDGYLQVKVGHQWSGGHGFRRGPAGGGSAGCSHNSP